MTSSSSSTRVALREDLNTLAARRIEALTVSLINAFANDRHERRIKEIAREVMPGVPVSLSSEVVPEMQEYERTVTTVANSYVRPRGADLHPQSESAARERARSVKLHILRSDGGLASARSAEDFPVNLLMSGPAGGVTGALWVAVRAGFPNLLTIDVGGTSTDVALINGGQPRLRRETTIGDITVRASSVDIRTVGAGGGLDCARPGTDRRAACRAAVGRCRAGPGLLWQGRHGSDGDRRQRRARLPAGAAASRRRHAAQPRVVAQQAVEKIGKALGKGVKDAALGIYDIVNENMVGACASCRSSRGTIRATTR